MMRLECAQRDYRLNVKLGFLARPESVHAEVDDGVLNVRVERMQIPTTYGRNSAAQSIHRFFPSV
jgi:HSP20 family molecular chaperone IbpA